MKRFYKDVTVSAQGDGWQVELDGRPIRTAGRKPQVVPTIALADALAAEWRAQGETIQLAAFVFRDLADSAIDIVGGDREGSIADCLRYAESDTLCYRAEPDEPLAIRQRALWDPLLEEVETRHHVRFERVVGILHRPQPATTLAAMRAAVTALDDFALASLRVTANLSASLVIGLAALAPDADAEHLWSAANLEEDFQAEKWGTDAEAQAHRAARFTLFENAIRFARLSRPGA
ncbi:ATP12 family chaperone protein [Novosphingobium tardum]|uniref:ATP12 family chaperone protein n=1 Tax=Novosphingobium tardum TaxID=1538021 RepID=A0ABV8RMI2_9SPHN